MQWATHGQQVRLPVAHMVCNQTPPIGADPSLMTFREVETLFHEFGHALQHMLTQQQEGLVAGIRGVEWDAVELPSQFMENWCYDRPTLFSFAKHYSTGDPLPEELFQKLKAAKCAPHDGSPVLSRHMLAWFARPHRLFTTALSKFTQAAHGFTPPWQAPWPPSPDHAAGALRRRTAHADIVGLMPMNGLQLHGATA